MSNSSRSIQASQFEELVRSVAHSATELRRMTEATLWTADEVRRLQEVLNSTLQPNALVESLKAFDSVRNTFAHSLAASIRPTAVRELVARHGQIPKSLLARSDKGVSWMVTTEENIEPCPPQSAELVLRLILPMKNRQHILGDLQEEYLDILRKPGGWWRATVFYWWQVGSCFVAWILKLGFAVVGLEWVHRLRDVAARRLGF